MKIKISLRSIKVNPTAGETVSFIQTGRTIEFNGTGQYIPELEEFITSCDSRNGKVVAYKGMFQEINGGLIEKIKQSNPESFNVTIHNHIQDVFHSPNPSYLFEYNNQKIKCGKCKSVFSYLELKQESIDNDECFRVSYNVCPKCGEWDCCKLEFEKINDAIKRMKKIAFPNKNH